MEHISLAVISVLARIANSGSMCSNAGEACCTPATMISAHMEKGEKMRLIDKDELSKLVGESFDYFLARLGLKCPPTVDAVEVVRCEDCKWWKTNYMWNGSERKVCVIEPYEPVRNKSDYCSKGERREDEVLADKG